MKKEGTKNIKPNEITKRTLKGRPHLKSSMNKYAKTTLIIFDVSNLT